jgi:hypothetical protein
MMSLESVSSHLGWTSNYTSTMVKPEKINWVDLKHYTCLSLRVNQTLEHQI